VAAAAVVLAGVVLPAVADARTASRALTVPFKLGVYTGKTAEQIPHSFTGKIDFIVHRKAITALSFTVGVVCKGMWVVDSDTLTHFKTRIHQDGAFSYSGTNQGRQILFKGQIKAGRATGSLAQAFRWGSERCAMSHSASFTATR
jgi:hypothetical protein